MGVLPAKRYLITIVDSFELPPPKARGPKSKNAQKPPVKKLTTRKPPRKPKVSKPRQKSVPKASEPKRRPEPTPAEVEANRQKSLEHARLQAQEQRRQAKAAGLCRDCHQPAIPDQTRCSVCAEKHRLRREASPGEGQATEGAGIRPNQDILKTTARTQAAEPSSRPGTGANRPAGTASCPQGREDARSGHPSTGGVDGSGATLGDPSKTKSRKLQLTTLTIQPIRRIR